MAAGQLGPQERRGRPSPPVAPGSTCGDVNHRPATPTDPIRRPSVASAPNPCDDRCRQRSAARSARAAPVAAPAPHPYCRGSPGRPQLRRAHDAPSPHDRRSSRQRMGQRKRRPPTGDLTQQRRRGGAYQRDQIILTGRGRRPSYQPPSPDHKPRRRRLPPRTRLTDQPTG